MRKITLITIVALAVLGVGGYLYLEEPWNPDRGELRDLSESFLEDIQFKDFRTSATYHHPDERQRVDIGRAIEDLFMVDPELIDILDYRITRTEIDSTGDRGRTLVSTRFRPLKPGAMQSEDDDGIEETELQLYWLRRHPDCPLGYDCHDGQCQDDAGQVATEEDPSTNDDGETEAGERPRTCDPAADRQWFMNLDSTLESRDYQ